jgi:hypothetical protein
LPLALLMPFSHDCYTTGARCAQLAAVLRQPPGLAAPGAGSPCTSVQGRHAGNHFKPNGLLGRPALSGGAPRGCWHGHHVARHLPAVALDLWVEAGECALRSRECEDPVGERGDQAAPRRTEATGTGATATLRKCPSCSLLQAQCWPGLPSGPPLPEPCRRPRCVHTLSASSASNWPPPSCRYSPTWQEGDEGVHGAGIDAGATAARPAPPPQCAPPDIWGDAQVHPRPYTKAAPGPCSAAGSWPPGCAGYRRAPPPGSPALQSSGGSHGRGGGAGGCPRVCGC